MPGDDFIEQSEIKRAVEGKRFWIFSEDGQNYLPGIKRNLFNQIYERWEDFYYFGLPLGKGSYHETSQTRILLKIGQRAFEFTENFNQRNAGKPNIDK